MSTVDEGNRIMQKRLTGQYDKKKTVSMKDIDPSFGTKDRKDQTLNHIEKDLQEIKRDIKKILRHLDR